MSIIKKTIFLLTLVISFTSLNAQEIKKIGKFKDWETIVVTDETAKLCFAQSKPVLQSPKNNVREARGGQIVSVKNCGDDPKYANDVYILVSLPNKMGAIVYQDNSDNSQMIETGPHSFTNMKKEFDEITKGEELFKSK